MILQLKYETKNHMISCSLQGGLGNQMFQIATTVALSLRNNGEYGINLNICYTPNQGHLANKYFDTIFKNVIKSDNYSFSNFYYEPNFSYNEIPYQDNLLIRGYFQSEKYFQDYENEIKKLFYFSDEHKSIIENYFNENNLNNKPITSVHIRRGDYLLFSDVHLVCTLDYYKKAIKTIGDSYFVFISDDINWVKENFISDNYFIPDFNDELLDLTLMTMCDNNIISNSSFSWWGAYLNDYSDKKIISPNRWFSYKGPSDIQDVLPKEWTKLDF
jgi:hypothetical protein